MNVGSPAKPYIAIIGAAIVGVILARELSRQKISVRVYEQAAGF